MKIRSRNPYSRRRGDRGALLPPDGAMSSGTVGGGLPRMLQIDDLDAIAFSAYQRGWRAAEEEAIERQRIAQLETWDEAHDQGVAGGWLAAAQVAEEQFGPRVSELHAMATERIGMIERMREAGTSPEAILAAEANALQGCVQFFEDLSLQMARRFPRQEEDRGAPAD